MDHEEHFEIYDGVVVPASALRQEQRMEKYGTVPDLPEEELADPDELERVVCKQMWWPILSLPYKRSECVIRPNIGDDGQVDFGAFATVDFDAYRPKFDKSRYAEEKLKEQIKDKIITLRIIQERIPGRAKYEILKRVKSGQLDTGHIIDNEMYFFIELCMRVVRLRKQLGAMQERRRKRTMQQLKAWLAA